MTARPGARSRRGRRRDELDPITFELVHAALVSVAEEMGVVLKRSSYSPIIREMDDFSCALFTARRRRSLRRPTTFPHSSARCRSSSGRSWTGGGTEIRPGDVFVANHPYMGAMHTPDVNILQPVFLDGSLFAWTGATAHHIDVGGVNPGTEGPDLRQLYAEGVVLPPVRLYREGEENRDVFDVLTENVRDPASTISDLRAQRAACALGERRICASSSSVRRGRRSRRGSNRRSTLSSERRAAPRRAARRRGGGRGVPRRRRPRRSADTDPRAADEARGPARGGSVGSAPQVAGAFNVPWASTRAGVVYALRAMTDPAMTTNDGILRPLEIVCPARQRS